MVNGEKETWIALYPENDRFEERCKNLSDKAKGFVALSIEKHYGKPISEIRHQYECDRWFYHHKGKFPWE